MQYGRRPSLDLAFQQHELKQLQRRGSGPERAFNIPGMPGHRGSFSGGGATSFRSNGAAAALPRMQVTAGGEDSDTDSTTSSVRKGRDHLEGALSQLQLKIRSDIREELRSLQKMREELRELPTRILADLARVDRHSPRKPRAEPAAAPNNSKQAVAPALGKEVYVTPLVEYTSTASSQNSVQAVLPEHGIGCEQGAGSGGASKQGRGAGSGFGSVASSAKPEEYESEARWATPRRSRKFTAKAHELDMWARKHGAQGQESEGSADSDPDGDNGKKRAGDGSSADDADRESHVPRQPEEPVTGCRKRLDRWVRGTSFDYLSGALVVLNAVTLGLQTDWQARHVTAETPMGYRVIEVMFCTVFTIEILLRAWAYGLNFFARQHIGWHFFDLFLVITQLLEEAMRLSVTVGMTTEATNEDGSKSGGGALDNLNILRVVRILRLIRVMRLMRILRLIGELRTLVMSIVGSLRSLVWAVALLFLMMYVMGVYLTQLILDHRLENSHTPMNEDMKLLVRYYGSLGDTVLSVYMSIFGGIDWENILSPLRNEVSNYITPFFMFYIAFATLCMLNVITGVFVESALLTAKQDQDSYLISTVQMVFDDYDLDKNGRMSFLEFQKSLSCSDMKHVLKLLEIDFSQAHGLFDLLDRENTGSINAKDFVMGCARLRGPAKALDLAILMREIDMQRCELVKHVEHVEVGLNFIADRVDEANATAKFAASKAVNFEDAEKQAPSQNILRQLACGGSLPVFSAAEVEEV